MGYSLAQLFCGALSDAWGRRTLLIIGLALYTSASLLAVYSSSITALILIRFVQGLGVAAPGVLARAIASDSYESDRLPAVTNYITLAWALGPILAPLIGGYLQHAFGWKAVFYFLTAYGCLALALVCFLLPETNPRRHPLSVKTLLHDYRIVLASPVFVGCALVLSIIYAYLILFNVVGPFLIQVVLHESPLVFGRVALCLGIAWFLGSLANRFLTAWFPISFDGDSRCCSPLWQFAYGVARQSICSFVVTSYSSYRHRFHERLDHLHPMLREEHAHFS
jgi:multidrug resistance protein